MLFVEIYVKNVKFGYLNPHFGEVRGDARPWLIDRWQCLIYTPWCWETRIFWESAFRGLSPPVGPWGAKNRKGVWETKSPRS